MENLWERFDDIAKPEEVMEAKSQFTPVEEGAYKAILEELVAGQSRSGLPMLKGKFRIVENNRILFYNQLLQNLNYPDKTPEEIAKAVTFISGILEEEIDFVEVGGLKALGELVSQIPTGSEHWVEVSYGAKDYEKKFTKLKIVDAPDELDLGEDTDDIPF